MTQVVERGGLSLRPRIAGVFWRRIQKGLGIANGQMAIPELLFARLPGSGKGRQDIHTHIYKNYYSAKFGRLGEIDSSTKANQIITNKTELKPVIKIVRNSEAESRSDLTDLKDAGERPRLNYETTDQKVDSRGMNSFDEERPLRDEPGDGEEVLNKNKTERVVRELISDITWQNAIEENSMVYKRSLNIARLFHTKYSTELSENEIIKPVTRNVLAQVLKKSKNLQGDNGASAESLEERRESEILNHARVGKKAGTRPEFQFRKSSVVSAEPEEDPVYEGDDETGGARNVRRSGGQRPEAISWDNMSEQAQAYISSEVKRTLLELPEHELENTADKIYSLIEHKIYVENDRRGLL